MDCTDVSLCVTNLGGKQCILELPGVASILQVKKEVVKGLQVPLEQQRLLLEAHECNDVEILSELQARLPCVVPLQFTLITRPIWQVTWLNTIKLHKSYRGNFDEDDDLFRLFDDIVDDAFHLSDLPAEAQADFAVVSAAVKKWPQAFNDVLPMFRTHPQMVLHALSGDGLILQQVAPVFQANRELVNAAVMQNWRALEFASPKLRADCKIVQNAISGDPEALRLAAPAVQADLAFVQDAMRRNWRAVQFASIEIRDTKELMLPLVTQLAYAVQYLGPTLCADRELMTRAAKAWDGALKYSSLELRMDLKLQRDAAKRAYSHFLERPRGASRLCRDCVAVAHNVSLPCAVRCGRCRCRIDRYSPFWMEHTCQKRSAQSGQHRCSQQEEIGEPSQHYFRHLRLQALRGRPCYELPKDQQHEIQVLEQKLGLHRATAIVDSPVDADTSLDFQLRTEMQQLQLLIHASPETSGQRQWSDRRRVQHLRCLPQKLRKDLRRQATTASQSEQKLAFNLKRAELKAHQRVCRNRRNASDHKKGKVQHLDLGKACTEVFFESEFGC